MDPDEDQPDIGIDNNIRCACGGATFCSAEASKTTYTCTACGQWVATMTHEFAHGAEIIEADA